MSEEPKTRPEITDRLLAAIEVLEEAAEDQSRLASLEQDELVRLVRAAGRIARPDPWAKRELSRARRRFRKDEVRAADEAVLARTGIRAKRREAVFSTPRNAPLAAGVNIDQALAAAPLPRVKEARHCYVCKRDFYQLHHFYDQMCTICAEINWRKRNQTADLRGRVALLTGARVKIGYQAGIFMLRAGARVIVTTRFPRDAAMRYAREADFAEWGHRLQVHGLDLRHTPSVDAFARHLLASLDRLDFIINNACQTVRRPAGFYGHLMDGEALPLSELPAPTRALLESYEVLRGNAATPGALTTAATAVGISDAAALSQLALLEEDLDRSTHIFPSGQLDADLQQIDLRKQNSWRLPLADVSAVELLEVQLVNAVAPFILNARLKPLMLRQPSSDKHIVNVSAMEGQFYRAFKTDKHPHTNMAKAALNMMTRTSASDYIKDGIHMNSVDTGWVTDEDPAEIAARKTEEHGFHPPLDIVDGAARIVDPIFDGYNTGKHVWGQFLKDYQPCDW
jgi:NAD(P)-dependent dehydrogenase (short-subunit alcohol dehydrogenase family)